MWAVCLAALLWSACSLGTARYPYDKEPDPRASEYVIGSADELAISIWKNRDLDSKIAVRPDGRITLPLVGDLRAAGKTPTELRELIRERLAAFMKEKDVTVTVAVTSVNSYFVTVAGNVVTPGRIAARSYLTVAEAIALAGGPTRFAAPSDAVLLRRSADGGLRRIPIDYDGISSGRRLEQNLVLFRGDRIYVP